MIGDALDGLLLDVGGPMLRLPFELVDEIERRYGLPAGHITWRGPFAPDTDPLWRELEAGRLSEREYWRLRAEEVERAAGRGGTVRDFMAECFLRPGVDVVRAETLALIADARAQGIRVGAVSNDAAWLLPGEVVDTLSVLAALDAFVDLSYAGVLKPQRKAYALALDALGLAPESVLFVDDQARNVAGAEAAGLHALPFFITDVPGSIARVRARLGLPA